MTLSLRYKENNIGSTAASAVQRLPLTRRADLKPEEDQVFKGDANAETWKELLKRDSKFKIVSLYVGQYSRRPVRDLIVDGWV